MILALLVRLAIAPISAGLQYVTFFPAVTLTAIFGGYRSGLLATAIGLVLATYIFTPPYYAFSLVVLNASFWPNMVFLLNGIIVSVSIEAMHRYREQFARELQQSQETEIILKQHKMMLDTSHDGFWVTDAKGYLLEVNQVYADISGYSIAELLRMHVSQLETKENFQKVQEHIAKIIVQGSDQFETRHRHKDGHEIVFEVSVNCAAESKQLFAFFRDITKRKQMEAKSEQAKQLMDSIINNIPAMVSLKRAGDLRFELFNRAGEKLLGYSANDLLGKNDYDIFPQEQAYNFTSKDREVLKSHEIIDIPREKIITLSGETRYLYTRKVTLRGLNGKPSHLLGISLDITELQKAEEELRIAAVIFEAHEAIMINDANGNILRVNQAFQKITGFSAEEVIGKNPRIFSSGRHDKSFYTKMWQQLLEKGLWSGEIWDRRKSGQIYPKSLTITALRDSYNEITGFVAVFSDITERKQAEEEIRNLALYDTLTKLPNRRLLLDRCQRALKASERSKQFGAVLFLDMDKFKILNDTLGHDYGDMLLIEVAQRIKFIVRESDTVARLGGDEFVVLVEDISENEAEASQKVALIAEKIRAALVVAYHLRGSVHHSSPSIGACLFNGNLIPVNDVLKCADIAMYQAKSSGRNVVRFYDPVMQQVVETRAALERDLRRAIENQQLCLYYQIQLSNDDRPLGAEALIRWIHPQRGMVSPAQFIPIAEESSLILEIGHWVLDTACQQLAKWRENELTRNLLLAINVSAHQFRMPDFVESVAVAVRTHKIDASRLELELTESVIVNDIAGVVSKMHALKSLGIRLSLDDFGTGYSSLSYLKQLPIDQIKIDQSFVQDIVIDPNDAVMVQAIIDMAKNFRLNVIAEGVESEAQLDFLKSHGCLAFQGYLFSKPVSIDVFEALLIPAKDHLIS